MASLYAVLFSTGLIKVGRSKSPDARIAEHARRLACTGMKIDSSVHAVCHGDDIGAEAALISRCSAAASQRHKDEWFEGIHFGRVTEWVREEAALEREPVALRTPLDASPIRAYLDALPPGGMTKMADAMGVSLQTLTNWRSRGVPASECKAFEAITGVGVQRLRDDWAKYWPEIEAAT